jgi:hypothetical protein
LVAISYRKEKQQGCRNAPAESYIESFDLLLVFAHSIALRLPVPIHARPPQGFYMARHVAHPLKRAHLFDASAAMLRDEQSLCSLATILALYRLCIAV